MWLSAFKTRSPLPEDSGDFMSKSANDVTTFAGQGGGAGGMGIASTAKPNRPWSGGSAICGDIVRSRRRNASQSKRRTFPSRSAQPQAMVLMLMLFAAALARSAPANDNFTNSWVLEGLTNTVTGSNQDATKEPGERDHDYNPGGASVWWSWTAPRNGTVTLDTIGSTFDTLLAVYWLDSSVLSREASDDQSGGNDTSRLTFEAVSGRTYYIAVDGWYGSRGNIVLNLRVVVVVIPPQPQITYQPQSQIVGPGDGARFSVYATGSEPISYQWYKDGMSIEGATGSFHQILNAQTSDAGSYSVDVSNAFGRVSSSNAVLTVVPPPSNDAFLNRIVISGRTNTVTGYNFGATKEPGEPDHRSNPGGKSVWWTWTAPVDCMVIVETGGSSFDTLLAVYTGSSVSNLSLVAGPISGPLWSPLIFAGEAGRTYQIAVDGWYADTGTIVLSLRAFQIPIANDSFADRIVIAGRTNTVTGYNVGATLEPGEPQYPQYGGGNSVWWTWKAPTNGPVIVDTIGSTFDTWLAVYTGSSVLNLLLVARDDDRRSGVTVTSKIYFSAVAGTEYQIAVNDLYETGDIVLNIQQPSSLSPQIINQPESRTSVAGRTASFAVRALGSPPPTYQWQFNGTALSGETNAVFVLNNVTTNQAGIYQVAVSNSAGTAMSVPAVLIVSPANVSFAGNWPGFPAGDAQDVQIVGSLAYVATSSGLLLLDVHDPENPRRVGGYPMDSAATRVVVKDYDAYVITSSNQFSGAKVIRIDVSNPALPKRVAEYVGTSPTDIALVGDYAYVTDANSVLVLTANCSLVGIVTTPSPVRVITAAGHHVYIGGGLGIVGYDISNPTNPVAVANFPFATGLRLAASENYLYEINHLSGSGVGLAAFDITDPVQPMRLGSWSSANIFVNLGGVAASGPFAYVVTGDIGRRGNSFSIVRKIDQPPGLTLLGTHLFAKGTGLDVSVAGNYAYVASGSSGLMIFDVTDPSSATVAGQFFTTVHANKMALHGNLAVVLDADVGFHIVAIDDPANPILVGSYQSAEKAEAILVRGHYVYLGVSTPVLHSSANYLEIVDIIDPSRPRRIGRVQFPGPPWDSDDSPIPHIRAIAIEGNLILLAASNAYNGSLSFLDVSSPTAPVVMHALGPSYDLLIRDMVVRGGYVYLAERSFQIMDIRNPRQPVRVGGIRWSPNSISLRGSLCFLDGLLVDVGQPTNPRLVTNAHLPAGLSFVQNNLGFTVDRSTGLKIFDISTATDPVLVGSYGGVFGEVASDGRHVFVAGNDSGMTILDLGAPFATPPEIVDQPEARRVLVGATANFFAAANGTVPLSYQWRFNGTNIPGAAQPLLSLTNIQSSDAGLYSVLVGNAVGTNVSVNAVLEVDVPPTMALTHPEPNTVLREPGTVSLEAEARDSDGSVAQVEFFQGDILLGVVTNLPFRMATTGLPTGTYAFRARATDNEGARTDSAVVMITVTNVPVFQLSRSNYEVNESNGVVVLTVRRNTSDNTAAVGLSTANGSARAVVEGGVGQYIALSNRFTFPPGVSATNVTIQLVNDLVYRGSKTFLVRLAAPDNGWNLAYPSEATVTIVDNDPLESTNSFTDVVYVRTNAPAGRGSLTVNLMPANALGKWRFAWETTWRDGGSTASGLVPGNYAIEFIPRVGCTEPAGDINVITVGASVTNTYFYSCAGNPPLGALGMTLLPAEVTAGTNRGQWRLQSDSATNWHDSGVILSGLPAGSHVVEFKTMEGFESPVAREVLVLANKTVTYEATYFLATPAPGAPPHALAGFTADIRHSLSAGAPYAFNGQLVSEARYGSGFVVKQRTVLTAAHVVFDLASLSYVTNVWWFFQQDKGVYEPVPQAPRGWYVFEGYAAARGNDQAMDPSGESSTKSRSLDVAALYFLEDAGPGGYGGYLVSGTGKDWLTDSVWKMLLGYPMENVPEQDRGRLHEVGPFFDPLEPVGFGTNQLYRTDQIRSYPGNSGGPVCVQTVNSLGAPFFIPAGVYLGGIGETVVRAIDLDIVDLINRAENSAHEGGDSTGGGVITILSGIASGSGHPGFLDIRLGPPAAIRLGAAWRVSPTNYGDLQLYTTQDITTNYFVLPIRGTNFSIEVKGLPGFRVPLPGSIELVAGAHVALDLFYSVEPPSLIYHPINGLGLIARATNTAYRIETTNQLLLRGDWPTVTNLTWTSGTNWIPSSAPTGVGSRFYRAVWLQD
jgi:hypothetical protein